MNEYLDDVWDLLLSRYQAGCKLVLLLDYDGSIVPIAEHPSLARLDPEGRDLLRQLAKEPRIFVGILSGRSLQDVQAMVGIRDLCYAGASGLELDLWGLKISHPKLKKARIQMQQLMGILEQVIEGYTGAWLENKRIGITVHYRGVAPHLIRELEIRLKLTLAPHCCELTVVEGPLALEITPALGWDKGSAVRTILDLVGADAVPMYAGDSANDFEAMATALSFGGTAIGIGPDAPRIAECRLPSPDALMSFLSQFHTALARPNYHCVGAIMN